MRFARKSLWVGLAMLVVGSCSPDHEVVPLDPLSVGRTGRPNDYLVCPQGRCDGADATAASYRLSDDQLYQRWLTVVRQAPRTRLIATDRDERLIHAEERSRIFRFVDTILVRIVADGGGSSFIAYSRSELGYGDLGVNRRRLERWIAALDRLVAEQADAPPPDGR